jgi:cellulose synthase/poly-beta-1,6-N-acetylglucosamine synthase-like glycosyltransferase
MKIAALIPVYAEPKGLQSICRRLAEDPYQDKEIVVVVDGETSPSIASALEAVSALPKLRCIQGRGHLGKAQALNRAALETEADAILFLDNDIFLPKQERFLGILADLLERRDLVELPKVGVGEGFLAEMMKLEFLSNIHSAEGMAGGFGACPSMNGAAFAIRKSLFEELGGFSGVINEDMDLAARAFLAGASFGFIPELAVGNAVSESSRDWGHQRKRWMTNNVLWTSSYLGPCLKSSPEAAGALLANSLRFASPWLALSLGALPAGIVASLLASPSHWIAAAGILGAGGLWSISAADLDRCAQRYGTELDLGAFAAYTFLYMPLVALANLGAWVAIGLRGIPKLDWKVAEGLSSRRAARNLRPALDRYRAHADMRRLREL